MKNIYFIVKELYPKAGGMTKSIYDRANFLSQHFNVTILVVNFQLHMERIHDDLIKSGKLDEKVKIKNIFIDLRNSNTKKGQKIIFDYESLLYQLDKLPHHIVDNNIRVFNQLGIYSNYIAYHNNGSLHFIDFMNNLDCHRLDKRYVFTKEDGELLSLDMMQDGQKVQQVIYNRQQQPILNLWHKNHKVYRVFDMRTNTLIDTNMDNIINSWLNSFIKCDDVVFIDSHFSDNSKYMNNIKCHKVGFIHSHQDYCNDTQFLKKFHDFDKFVFLTHNQRNDFLHINENIYEKSVVIPHPAYNQSNTNIVRKNKIITISRLVHNKPIEQAIRAFANISDKFPEYVYEIYGIGPDEEKLKKLIQDLNMHNKIILKGYTNSSLDLFSESQLSISLTKYEGYGLSILESLSSNCPVITSNVKYGPSEMIIDGVNGHLVNNNNIDEIENAIKNILSNTEKYQSHCKETIQNNDKNIWENSILSVVNMKNTHDL